VPWEKMLLPPRFGIHSVYFNDQQSISLPQIIQFISTTNKVLASSIAKIADNSTFDTAALTAAEIVAKASFDIVIKALDGKKVRKYTTIAQGTRVPDYKQQVAAARQKINHNQKLAAENVELNSADELQQLITQGAPGTPEGNKSIISDELLE
jgi:hypothetical protein